MNFYRWLGVSLLLHAVVLAPFVLHGFRRIERPEVANLKVDLFEMVADREQEEKKKAGDPLAPEEIAQPQPAPAPKTEAKPEEELQPAPPPPMEAYTEMAELTPDTPPAPEVPTFAPRVTDLPVASGVAGGTGTADIPSVAADAGGGSRGSGGRDNVDQAATRQGRRGPVDPFAAYTAMVARRLQDNLIYPSEMRKKGIEGTVTIVFTITESGKIKRGSLKVRESSGYEPLDNGAVKSARSSEPFMKPPRKEMTLAIEVSFEADAKKGG
jgi:TonB family protein